MITDFAKMTTGLVMRGGLGLPLRAATFAAMVWGAWVFVPAGWEWACAMGGPGDGNIVITMLALAGPVIGAVIGLCCGRDGHRVRYGDRPRDYSRESWRMLDFLRRAPFICWCLVTDDGRNIPIWAILSWPAIAMADFILAVMVLVAVPSRWIGLAMAAAWRLTWRILSIKPLDSGGGPT